jgi:crotonobetainyl-CoA:carnitine CoA-transferase CaiB-like acyl-CoA transferase
VADVEPLRGVRVLDLTTFLSGPLLARNLADLGAEVIKIEPPAGDPTRPKNGDPFSPVWLNVHRGRRGMVLDLKSRAGRDVLLDLAEHADVLVENYRPGVTGRLGVDAAPVRARNPRLVYATITGFGPDGPVAEQVSIDGPVQAFAGSIELAELNGVELMPMPITVADIAGASSATQGVLGALLARERTGEGCHIDVSLFEAVLPWINVNRRAALAPPVTLIVEGGDGGRFIVQTPIHFHSRLLQLAGSVPGCEALATEGRFATR